jgi:hypothetical protein
LGLFRQIRRQRCGSTALKRSVGEANNILILRGFLGGVRFANLPDRAVSAALRVEREKAQQPE